MTQPKWFVAVMNIEEAVDDAVVAAAVDSVAFAWLAETMAA